MGKLSRRAPIPSDAADSGHLSYQGRRYEFIRASDVINGGMWLEMNDVTNGAYDQVMSAFWSDLNEDFTFHCYRTEVPFVLVEFFLAMVRPALTPESDFE